MWYKHLVNHLGFALIKCSILEKANGGGTNFIIEVQPSNCDSAVCGDGYRGKEERNF
jgi:hypothetical protein